MVSHFHMLVLPQELWIMVSNISIKLASVLFLRKNMTESIRMKKYRHFLQRTYFEIIPNGKNALIHLEQ